MQQKQGKAIKPTLPTSNHVIKNSINIKKILHSFIVAIVHISLVTTHILLSNKQDHLNCLGHIMKKEE